jgi:integrase/recombinase XerD
VTDLAPLLQGFFTDRLARQKNASPHTVAAYRDTCRLLLVFVREQTGKAPNTLSLADLDATLIGAFLQHLQQQRGNGGATRNARLAAIHSLFRYAAPRAPEHAAVISQVLAIPPRRRERAIVSYLTPDEIDALLTAPDRKTWHGRRDHALLLLAVQTGLRLSELTALTAQDVHPGAGPPVRCHGKGRKDRATPLTSQTVKVLKTWLAELGPTHDGPLFPPGPAAGSPATPSSGSSPSTPPPQTAARRSRGRRSPRTRCGTPPPCRCCGPGSTPRSSLSGSATRTPRPPRSTYTPT